MKNMRRLLHEACCSACARGKTCDGADDTVEKNDPERVTNKKLLAKARKEGSEMSVRSEMMRLLGETRATSTGATNKPSKKTPQDCAKPPGVATSGADDEADGVDQPFKNKPLGKEPRKSSASPPNVQTSSVADLKRMTRIFAGIDSKYELGDTLKPVETDDTIVSESMESDDPILKLALEGMRDGGRHHPFE